MLIGWFGVGVGVGFGGPKKTLRNDCHIIFELWEKIIFPNSTKWHTDPLVLVHLYYVPRIYWKKPLIWLSWTTCTLTNFMRKQCNNNSENNTTTILKTESSLAILRVPFWHSGLLEHSASGIPMFTFTLEDELNTSVIALVASRRLLWKDVSPAAVPGSGGEP